MPGSAFLGVQPQHAPHQQLNQQHGVPTAAPKQSTGLLYQNIPLPGSAGGSSSGSGGNGSGGAGGLAMSPSGLSGLFMSGQGQPQSESQNFLRKCERKKKKNKFCLVICWVHCVAE